MKNRFAYSSFIRSIGFFPTGDLNAASSRIRAYSLCQALTDLGITPQYEIALRNISKQDVVFIQKKVTRRILRLTRLSSLLGKLVIYDIDDLGPHMWYFLTKKHFRSICKLANVITVSTNAQKEYLEDEFHLSNIHVLPCTIDYFPEKPVRNIHPSDDTLKIIWFGGAQNFHSFETHIVSVLAVPNSQLVVVTTSSHIDHLQEKYPEIEFKNWSLNSIIDDLRACDLSILTHEGEFHDHAKSNNKMIASITWGVPALVSNTPDYSSTAHVAGIPEAVFTSTSELIDKIEQFRSAESRFRYLDHAQKAIWDLYSPKIIAGRLLEICSLVKVKPFLVRLKDVSLSIFSEVI